MLSRNDRDITASHPDVGTLDLAAAGRVGWSWMGSWSRWTSGAARTSNAGCNGCTSLPRRRRRPPGHQVESPQPDPVGSVHHSPRARVQTFPLHAVGIPELRVVEDVAASTGTSTAMRPIGSDPLCAATRHPGPHNLLIRSFGQGSSTGRPAAMSAAS